MTEASTSTTDPVEPEPAMVATDPVEPEPAVTTTDPVEPEPPVAAADPVGPAPPEAAANPQAERPADPAPEVEAGIEPIEPDFATEPVRPDGESGAEVSPAPGPALPAEPEQESAQPEADRDTEPETDGEAESPVPEPSVGPRTAGRFLADALHAAGVRVAFTVPGESFLGLLDALGDAGIRVVATRHEGGAAFMAEAYGQLTGRPAACLATRAVGASNLAIGIHTARADSTPMFAIVGQAPRAFRGREAFQEIDLAGSIGRLAVHATEIDDPARLPAAMADATRHALGGRPGPVLVAVPEDVLDLPMAAGTQVSHVVRSRPPDPDPDVVRLALHRLTAARRPVILAGSGVLRSRSTADLVRLAEILEIPVISSWRRGDVFPNDHSLYLGMAGYGAPATVPARLRDADEILVVGCRLNEITSGGYRIPGEGQRWTHIDLVPRTAHAGLQAPDLTIPSDARTFLRIAARLLSGAIHDKDSLDERRVANVDDRAAWEAAALVDQGEWAGPGVHPGRIITTLGKILPPEAIVTTDAGNIAGWLARGYRWRRPGTFLGPTSGAMGYGLPAAIAASLVHRERPVVAVAGDGGFAMTMAELETAVRERCRLVVLVFDNRRYGTIWMHQEERGTGVGVATELGTIDVAAVAEGFGARGVRIESDAGFEPALRDALAADGPTVIHLPLDRAWVSVDRPAAV